MVGFVILTLPMGLFFGWLGKRLAVAQVDGGFGPLRRAGTARTGAEPSISTSVTALVVALVIWVVYSQLERKAS